MTGTEPEAISLALDQNTLNIVIGAHISRVAKSFTMYCDNGHVVLDAFFLISFGFECLEQVAAELEEHHNIRRRRVVFVRKSSDFN